MDHGFLRRVSRAFFLQDLVARAIGALPAILQNNLGKYDSLKKAFYLTSHDEVEGDYLEFGVFTGASMAAAIRYSREGFLPRSRPVRYFGFDSFSGFGEALPEEKAHGWLRDQNFQSDEKMVRRRLLKLLNGDEGRLRLVPGYYQDTLAGKRPADYGADKASVILIDCDLYSSACHVFDFIGPALQEGTILVVDDFFLFRGSTTRGVYGAFKRFEEGLKDFTLRRMWDYGCGGVAYIVTR